MKTYQVISLETKGNLKGYKVWCTTNNRKVLNDFILYVLSSLSGLDDFRVFCPSDGSYESLTEVANDLGLIKE